MEELGRVFSCDRAAVPMIVSERFTPEPVPDSDRTGLFLSIPSAQIADNTAVSSKSQVPCRLGKPERAFSFHRNRSARPSNKMLDPSLFSSQRRSRREGGSKGERI
jgi:hypothetical protein